LAAKQLSPEVEIGMKTSKNYENFQIGVFMKTSKTYKNFKKL
jgi:hypothetical protein